MLAVVLTALANVPTAEAGVVTATGWYSAANGSPTPRNLSLVDWNNGSQVISVAQFDTVDGTRVLDSATLTFFGDIDTTGTLTAGNVDVEVNNYTLRTRMRLLPGSYAGLYNTTATALAALATVSPVQVSLAASTVPANTVVPINNLNSIASTTLASVTGAALMPYIGTGSILYHIFTNTTTTLSLDTGAFATNLTTFGRASVSVDYVYHIADIGVPEPATWAMLCLALAGMAAIRLRRA